MFLSEAENLKVTVREGFVKEREQSPKDGFAAFAF